VVNRFFWVKENLTFKDPTITEGIVEALRKAGLK